MLIAACRAPYQWLDGSAYVNHVALVRQARGAEVPASFWTDPLMYQGISDIVLGPRDPIPLADEAWGIDIEAEVVVILGDVPMGATRDQAAKAIQLIMLVNDVTLRNITAPELAKGFGFLQSKPPSAFTPVAVTPDELGQAWDGAKVDLPLLQLHQRQAVRQTALLGRHDVRFPDADRACGEDAPARRRHHSRRRHGVEPRSRWRPRQADLGRRARLFLHRRDQRTVETILHGKPSTPFLKFGDSVRIEMNDKDGHSIFGAIEQEVVRYTPPQ